MQPVALPARELLAAFPGGQRSPPFLPRVPRPGTSLLPATPDFPFHAPSELPELDALRDADPLVPAAMLRALDRCPGAAPLAWLLRAQLALGRLGLRVLLRWAVANMPFGVLLAPIFVFGGDRFSQHSVAVGTAAACLLLLASPLAFLTSIRMTYGVRGLGAPGGAAQAPQKPNFNLHAFAGLIRWIQLMEPGSTPNGDPEHASEPKPPASAPSEVVLLAHQDGDSACPCPRVSCSGGLPQAASTFALLDIAAKMIVGFVNSVFLYWTALITLGGYTWTSWWGALLGVWAVLGWFVNIPVTNLVRRTTNTRLLALQGRIHRRLLGIALADLVERSWLAISCTAPVSELLSPSPEPYEVLHAQMTTVWRSGLEFLAFGRLGYVFFLAEFATCAAINAIGAGCIPLWTIFGFLYVLALFIADLINVAASNNQIEATDHLMGRVRADLQSFLVRAAVLGGAERQHACDAVSRHADLLATLCASSSASMGTLLGFRITFGVLRRMAVTVVTVAVALYTVLRGSGIYLTPETVCPG
ncbi:hypothetical protein DFJ74DRAFT_716185 [Hyaloraphidium curvatum]|nr:hypothetical protein DFJ74DRAFT_716185 [Hyaloraphidium curvatum]